MKAVLGTMALSGRSPGLQATDDVKFHALLARASQSGAFMHLMAVLQDTLGAALTLQANRNQPSREDAQTLLGLNRSLVEALAHRDEDRAADLAVQHAAQRRLLITRAVPVDERRAASSQAAE